MLISIAEVFETSVSTLLGETVVETKADELSITSEKLEIINLQLAHKKAAKQKALHWIFISLCTIILAISTALFVLNSPYLNWDYSHPENLVVGVMFQAFEWIFIRMTPFALIGSIIGICLTRNKA